jgi:hypothetical protein
VYWHAHLPRQFWWFLPGDFVAAPLWLAAVLQPAYWGVLAVYAVRAVVQGGRIGAWNPGKHIVVATTALCWYVGIVALNSDVAFTVTNVLIHGVPYIALAYCFARGAGEPAWLPRSAWGAAIAVLATVWVLAYAEELLWDRAIWHERSWLFGEGWIGVSRSVCLAALAVPQITHYVLDGFIWRVSRDERLRRILSHTGAERT